MNRSTHGGRLSLRETHVIFGVTGQTVALAIPYVSKSALWSVHLKFATVPGQEYVFT